MPIIEPVDVDVIKSIIEYLVEKGIDSITVNADVAKEISEYVKEIEQDLLGKKGELPRHQIPSF